MNINGKVIEIAHDQTIAKNGGGSYRGTRITYRDADGALKEKAIHVNALKFNPVLNNQLKEIKNGDDITIVMEKEGEFWNVKSVHKGGMEPAPVQNGNGKAANASPRSTYETPEERAKKQVLIVRQSSVTSAIAFSATQKTPLNIDDVLGIAERISAFVFDTEFDDGSLETMPNDPID